MTGTLDRGGSHQLEDVEISGYYPGVAGRIIQLHAVYYHDEWGFDITFETQVGSELCQFLAHYREGRDLFRIAKVAGSFAGSIAVDGRDKNAARVRWFIVDSRFRNRGIGRLLLDEAVHFCRIRGRDRVVLFTFEGLDKARYLYEQYGFVLVETQELAKWGQTIREQKFELVL